MSSRPLIIGLVTEGPTDVLFLTSIIKRTFEDLIMDESDFLPEVYDVEKIDPEGKSFVEQTVNAAEKAHEIGVMILCIHADADAKEDADVYEHKILPAMAALKATKEACKILVPVVPVRMTEAWMLADLELLKDEIGTDKSNETLKLTRAPEAYADPKQAIVGAIAISQLDVAKRRKRYEITISDLYQPIGQKVDLKKLELLPSYQKFKESARAALLQLGFLR